MIEKEKMKEIKVDLKDKSYKIYVGCKLEDIGIRLKEYKPGRKILVVTNPIVEKFYLDTVVKSLQEADWDVYTAIVPDGEKYKSQAEVSKLYNICIEKKLDRKSTILALGGGVIGDLAGFLAATIFRGVSFIQVPTTLLAQVDASIGGKVGINHPRGKNLIGAFYQPKAVLIDLNVLKTLPQRELKIGLAETIKYGVIRDKDLFFYLEKNIQRIKDLDLVCLEHIIQRADAIKALVVQKDEQEKDLRRILNYGHTAGHVIETMMGYKGYKHGEAVAIGMVVANRIAQKLGMLKVQDAQRIKKLIEAAGLPTEVEEKLALDEFINILKLDKKVEAGKINFVLPTEIGEVVVRNDVPEEIVGEIIKDVCKCN